MTRPRKPARATAEPPTERVVGLAAVRAVLSLRPRDALNVAHTREARDEVGDILRRAAQHRVAYRELSQPELNRLADTVHHEGICMLARARPVPTLRDLRARLQRPGFVLALDRVDNPHNVGAILRSAAFFGAQALLVTARDHSSLTPAMVRIAEGGAERVPVLFTPDLAAVLDTLAAQGVGVIGADGAAPETTAELAWPVRCAIVLGSERSGISEGVRKRCHRQVRIDGSGHMESLNVSVAAGILMASRFRAQGTEA